MKIYSKTTHDKRFDNRHPIEERYQTNATKRTSCTHPIPTHNTARAGKIDEGTSRESRKGEQKLLCIPRCDNHKKDKSVKKTLDSRKLNENGLQ